MLYRDKILTALRAADRPLRHRDLCQLIDPTRSDYSAWNGIGVMLTKLFRAGFVTREKIDHYYHYRIAVAPQPTRAALLARIAELEAERDTLRRTIILMRDGGMELPGSLVEESEAW